VDESETRREIWAELERQRTTKANRNANKAWIDPAGTAKRLLCERARARWQEWQSTETK